MSTSKTLSQFYQFINVILGIHSQDNRLQTKSNFEIFVLFYFLLCNEANIHSLSVHNLSSFSHLANLDGRWGTGVARQAGLEGWDLTPRSPTTRVDACYTELVCRARHQLLSLQNTVVLQENKMWKQIVSSLPILNKTVINLLSSSKNMATPEIECFFY